MKTGITLAAVLLLTAGALSAEEQPATRWEKTIAAFEARDRKNSVPAGAVLFVGSSSIVRWETAVAFPDLAVINRGFGGSYLSDTNHYYDRIVAPYRPRVIVLYAGDNDVAAGMSPERIAREFRTFAERTARELPQTKIIFVAIKPSLARWEMWPTMAAANKLVAEQCRSNPLLFYADIATPALGADGQPRADLLHEDKLHLSPKGYEMWNRVVGGVLAESR